MWNSRHPGRKGIGDLIDRRTFVGRSTAAVLGAVGTVSLVGVAHAGEPRPESKAARIRALQASPFIYVSPLRSDGSESRCHGEVWFGWLDSAAVIITSSDSWKSRSVSRGLDHARIWVGDYGRARGLIGTNERFRAGPHFEARASAVRDDELLERLLALFEQKYPDEIDHWRDRMRDGYRDGTRQLVRYVPISPSAG
ncbi:hypothetical protein MK489_01200 [Myxococcota bacterium]|nr:hypothetical protein [Myxococcota bacterium]